MEKKIIDKVILSEAAQRKVDLLTEEFNARGGMSTKELISRLNAIPFEEFMRNLVERIRNYVKD